MSYLTGYGTPSFRGSATGFRVAGDGATATNNLLTIASLADGPRIRIASLEVLHNSTAALVTPGLQAIFSRTTAIPTGGTALVKRGFSTTGSTSASSGRVEVLYGTASDGGAATPITATAEAGAFSQKFLDRLHTAVGQALPGEVDLLPGLAKIEALIIPSGGGVVVQALTVDAANIPITDHFIVLISWEEY